MNHPEAVVWREDPTLDVSRQGLNVLTLQHSCTKRTRTGLLFERIPHVVDVQVAWLLLTFCAATRAPGCSNVCATCCTFSFVATCTGGSSCCRGCSCSDHHEDVSSRNRGYSPDSPILLEVRGRICWFQAGSVLKLPGSIRRRRTWVA